MSIEKSDVVFVVEKSITFKRYLSELFDSYVYPAVTYFSGGLDEDKDVIFTQSSLVHYAVVYFGSEFNLLGSVSQLESFGPTCSEKEVLNSIKNANYCCQNTNRQAYIVEGLNAAFNIFQTLQKKYGRNEPCRRCCILLTQSSPLSNPFTNVSCENVTQNLKILGVKLSVISAHKIPELIQLFDSSGGDFSVTSFKNYSVKSCHLVLLNGLVLQEQPLSPSVVNHVNGGVSAACSSVVTSTVGMNVINSGQSPGPLSNPSANQSPGLVNVGSPAASGGNVQQTSQLIRAQVVANSMQHNQSSQVSGMPPLSQQQVAGGVPIRGMMTGGQMRPGIPNMVGPNQRPRWPSDTNMVAAGNAVSWNQGNTRPMGMMNMVSQADSSMGGKVQNTNIQNSQAGMMHIPMQQQTQISQQQQVQQQPNQNHNRVMTRIVWQGTLEFVENRNDPPAELTHKIPCKATNASTTNGEVNTDGWPSVLTVKFVPKQIITTVAKPYLRNVQTIVLNPESCPELEILANFLDRGMVGYVYWNNGIPNDIHVIIIIHSTEKSAYVGFILHDPESFINSIRSAFPSRNQVARKGLPGMQGNPTSAGMVNQGMQSVGGMNVMVSQGNCMTNPQMVQNMNQSMAQGNMGNNQIIGASPVQIGTSVGQPNPQIPGGQSVLASQLIRGQQVVMPQQQQQQQIEGITVQIRPNQQQAVNIRQQLQNNLHNRPNMAMNMNQGMAGTPGQPRLMPPMMQNANPGMKQLYQQRFQQQQMMMMQQQQQQGMHPQMAQQQVMGQQVMSAQNIQENTDYMDMINNV